MLPLLTYRFFQPMQSPSPCAEIPDLAFTSITTGIGQALEGLLCLLLAILLSPSQPSTISNPSNLLFLGRRKEIIEAQHVLANATSAQGPQSYIPFPRDHFFQPRPGKFERARIPALEKRARPSPCKGKFGRSRRYGRRWAKPDWQWK